MSIKAINEKKLFEIGKHVIITSYFVRGSTDERIQVDVPEGYKVNSYQYYNGDSILLLLNPT